MNNDLTFSLSEAISAFCRTIINQKHNLPIRSSEMGSLIYITQNSGEKGVLAVELSEYFGIRKSSVTAMISSLEKQGFIIRTVSQEDKRINPIFPTDKGRRLVEETIEEYHNKSKMLIEKIGTEKCEEFLELLKISAKILQEGDRLK